MFKILKWLIVIVMMGGILLMAQKYLRDDQTLPKEKMLSIGVIQVIEHPALDQTRQGILDELKEAGLIPLETMQWVYESAQGNPALAAQVAQKFVGQKVDLIVTLGTTPSQAAVQATQTPPHIPVVFASVTDPVSAKLITNPQQPDLNVTGVSNYVDVDKQFEAFLKVFKPLKKLGILYNPGEANSVILVEKMQESAKKYDITLILAPAGKATEVLAAAQNLVGKVDAIFINNDNTALAAFGGVAKVGEQNNIPIFVSDVDFIAKGAVAALGPDQYALGRQTGKMIIKVLKDRLPINQIPVEWPSKVELKINFDIARKLGLQLVGNLANDAQAGN
ncbi:ABC transporter substrate-binding protein [Candidatus Finniella inopinata]|uniref:ABC transporter substrate-binding protein n=1 Tax=Candidatus Finniella inopinata TaxID=1696036 RepID=A0A4Q7DMK0_9PROT|nr:ABC transporter substrate-binding protein [Candidatus Finniella inopinata]RZI46036.1 ABC transporter substrate-binding protein [Candidatus Finniella inopinata]